jgi:hypothetical protein
MATPPPDTHPYDPAMQPIVQIALQDLSERLDIPVEQIAVLEAEAVVWGDTSMGCPQPGMAYLQVPQDGARIRLSAGGQMYNYHSGGIRPPFLCQQAEQRDDKNTPTFGEDILPPPSPGDE